MTSIQQRYLSARGTSRLRLTTTRQTAADVLTASGWVASASARRALALDVWSVLATENMRGANKVAEELSKWIRKRSFRDSKVTIRQTEALDIAMMVLKWWKRPACLVCGGHGQPRMPDSPTLDESKVCPSCNGTGQIPLEKLVKPAQLVYAEWLAGEIELMCSRVFDSIARRLRNDMDF